MRSRQHQVLRTAPSLLFPAILDQSNRHQGGRFFTTNPFAASAAVEYQTME